MEAHPKNNRFVTAWIEFLKQFTLALGKSGARGCVSTRLKFLCQEVIEMSQNGWKGKYKVKEIMTKEESRQKAAQEEAARAARTGRSGGSKKRGKGGGGRKRGNNNNNNNRGRPKPQNRNRPQAQPAAAAAPAPASAAKALNPKTVKAILDEFKAIQDPQELFISFQELAPTAAQAADLMGLVLKFCSNCSPNDTVAVEKIALAVIRVIRNKETDFDFSWATPVSLVTAIRHVFDVENRLYLGEVKIDNPKADLLLATTLAVFITQEIIPGQRLLAHLAESEQAADARDSGLAASFCRHLLNVLKAGGTYDTEPFRNSPLLAGLPRWDSQKEHLE